MSFREKSAWITLITLIALSILFFLHFPRPWSVAPAADPSMFHVMMLLIATFIVVEIIGHIAIAIWSPRDARAPKDERERLIALKSAAIAGYVYAFTSLGSVFITVHLTGGNGNLIGLAYLILASFVLAEIVQYGLRVYYFRRGL